jgi:hypothetical protein
MKNINIILFSLIVTSCSSNGCCNGANNEAKKNQLPYAQEQKHSKYWINYEYLTCLNDNLPCDCVYKVDFTLLDFDFEKNEVLAYDRNSDGGGFYLKNVKQNHYEMYMNREDQIPFLNARIKNDTLYLENNGEITRFISYSDQSTAVGYNRIIGNVNISYVLNSINHDNSLSKTLKITESTSLLCNAEIGNINVLFKAGQCENAWIFETSKDKVHIYKFENACNDKSIPFEIKKTLVYSLPITE